MLVGFSMGGFVARVLTLMAPERVSGVAFVASSARGYTEAETRAAHAGRPARRPAASAPVPAWRSACIPTASAIPCCSSACAACSGGSGREVRARQSALVRKDGYADLERIACPSLVVACRQDRLRSFGETERMAKHLPHARFEIIEDCGHMAPLEKPHELAALLAAGSRKRANQR